MTRPAHRRFRRRVVAAAFATVLTAALVAGSVSATAASAARDGDDAPVLGGFGLGDGLEGLINEQDGSLSLSLSAD